MKVTAKNETETIECFHNSNVSKDEFILTLPCCIRTEVVRMKISDIPDLIETLQGFSELLKVSTGGRWTS
ncbi:hypothetical protein J2Z76_000477 [Sedimentibacter acidaminivorans]|uniref:Uncharacterized protein n=1 Tax=Sedimentibacter acidaminivorans TaxID=913099 RepID=A0ABS4GAC9_9FIRM|nr:hypothetical protein [Sedimentibacter acidaminivorans]MBP1924624.1 hypothetical protein [Sedimentibacter acidaminivorans]